MHMKRQDVLPAPLPGAVTQAAQQILEFKIDRLQSRRTAIEFFTPQHYEPGYAYPLVVWLHGPGDNERQLRRVMPLTSTRNYVAAAPRAPRHDGSTAGMTFRWDQKQRDIDVAAARVLQTVRVAQKRYNIHPQRIFLAGYLGGGAMAIRLALRNPELFAGAASIGGGFPQGCSPLARLSEARSLPMLMIHLQKSNRYPESQLCEDLRLLHTAGMKIDLHQYLCGDELSTDMFEDLNRWLMQKVCGG